MSNFHALDIAAQRNITRLAIELFLYDLAEQRGSPVLWKLALADHAIAAYQSGELDSALACISAAEKPAQPPSQFASSGAAVAELSLRNVWCRLLGPTFRPSVARAPV